MAPNSATSIHDAPQPDQGPRRRKRILGPGPAMIIGGAAVLTAAALITQLTGPGSTADPTEQLGGFADEVSVIDATGHPVQKGRMLAPGKDGTTDISAARVDVLIDGWSVRTLQGRPITAQVGDQRTRVNLKPITAEQLTTVMKSTPEAIARTLARTITADTSLKCDTNGCATDSGPISSATILNPASVPGFGPSYKGWGMKALIYVASVTTTGDPVTISAPGYREVTLPATPPGAAKDKPTRDNGYLVNRHVLAAGLGSVFHADPAWVESPKGQTWRWRSRDAAASPSGNDRTVSIDQLTAPSGLTTPVKAFGDLSDSQMTYLTSPSTGCGFAVLCAPSAVEAGVSAGPVRTQTVCSPQGKTTAVQQTSTVKATLPHPIHQSGTYAPSDVKGGQDSGVFGGGRPPLTASVDARLSLAGIVSSSGALANVAGRNDPSSARAATLSEVLQQSTFDGQAWKAC